MSTEEFTATKIPRVRKTLADLEALLAGTDLTYVAVGGKYRAANLTENGHTYASEAYSLRELLVWLEGYSTCAEGN